MIRLNASALPRVLACLGSVGITAALELTKPPETDAAREGTAAHWVAETCLLGFDASHPNRTPAPNGVPVTAEMIEHGRAYAEACATDAKHVWTETTVTFLALPNVEIAAKLDRAWLEPGEDGSGGTLFIRDYKYGWRLVEPEGNVQLIAYAVGLLRKLTREGFTFADRTTINLGIYQPRPYHPDGPLREWVVSLGQLADLWDQICMDLAGAGISNELVTGPHCEYCPAGVMDACPAYRIAAGNAVDVAIRGGAAEPTLAGLGRELGQLQRARQVLDQREEWVKDIVKRALKEDATAVPGWAVEVQRGNTVWTIDADALKQLTNIDVTLAPKLVTPAEAKRRGVSEDVITANTTRPVIGDKLVRQDADALVRKKLTKPRKAKT